MRKFTLMSPLMFLMVWCICSVLGFGPEYRVDIENYMNTTLVAICRENDAIPKEYDYEHIATEKLKIHKVSFKPNTDVCLKCYLAQMMKKDKFRYVDEIQFFNNAFVEDCASRHGGNIVEDCGYLGECTFAWKVEEDEVSCSTIPSKEIVYVNPWKEDKTLTSFSNDFQLDHSRIQELLLKT